MPAEFWTAAAAMAMAGGFVAAAAVPVGAAAWALARRPLLPRAEPWRVPFGGFELTMAFALVLVIQSAVASAGALPVAVGVIALPIQLAVLVAAWRALVPRWKPFRTGTTYPGLVAVAVLVWAVLTPVVLLVHAAVTLAFGLLDLPLDEHPLTQMGGRDALDRFLFALQACVAAPVIEEVMFRGLLLSWTTGGRERHACRLPQPPVAPPVVRPWLVMGFGILFAATSGKTGPVVFAGLLAAGLGVVWVTVRRGKRHVRGIYATAAFFALIHASVWPSPIPLFVLGLGLGWLAARTRGVLAPILVHGLFNAVSAVFVLRGAG